MYEIDFTQEALKDLVAFRKFEQQIIVSGIDAHLVHEPTVATCNRFRMRANEAAEWELRIDRYRVFYKVAEDMRIVRIEVIGFKRGDQLFVRGKRREL
jgi:mRNA-degrading endonuclease RelE of RelBE toxin-antitoxin system